MQLNVSTLAVVMGLGLGLPQVYGLMKPAAFGVAVRKFPRSLPWGYALMLLGTLWFVWNVKQENNADFAAYKPLMMAGFTAAGVAVCVFVTDFLAVRGLAIVFMCLAKLMVDTVRWADTDWRWVISGWAYVLVIAGIWFTVSPWRLRDLLNWATADPKRIRVGSAIRLLFGLFVALLGLTVFRATQ
ncbi:MAG: hypothetical protein HY298_22215 [Verrucomicrobia bacterium]|nr:hypothetical protein [Verrucomicrobiota bacterium]